MIKQTMLFLGLKEKFNGRREEGAMVVIGSVSSEQNRKLDGGRWKSRSNTM